MTILPATTSSHFSIARNLFREYQREMDIDLCFQSFEEELATLPGRYASPRGTILIAYDESQQPVGCVALRTLSDTECEMKRLFIRPAARGHNLGRRLISDLIAFAREQHFTSMFLDTLPGKMDRAIALYRQFGFREVPNYNNNPYPAVIFFELHL